MRYPYRSLGVAFNREYRNDLNLNFTDIAADMAELASRTNIALEAADEAETQALFAQTQGNYAQDQGDFAYTQGAFAQAQGNIAQSNESTRQANEAARNTAEADRYSAEVLRESAEDTRESNETTRQANETVRQSQEAARQAAIVDIEQTANDADQKATTALQYTVGKYLTPVDTFTDIATTYPTPDANDRVFVRDTGKTFIYQDGSWQEFAELNETPINELDNRLTQQLADIFDSTPVSIFEFGADRTGATSIAQSIRDAIDKAVLVNGHVVIPPNDVPYRFDANDKIVVPKGVHVLSKGVIKRVGQPLVVQGFFEDDALGSGDNFFVGLHLEGEDIALPTSQGNGAGIFFRTGKNIKVIDCTFKNMTLDGVRFDGANDGLDDPTNVKVSDCRFENSWRAIWFKHGGVNINVSDNLIDGIGAVPIGVDDLSVGESYGPMPNRVIIKGNIIKNFAKSFTTAAILAVGSSILVIDNIIEDGGNASFGGGGISVSSGGQSVSDFNLTQGTIISRNTIKRMSSYGITGRGLKHAIIELNTILSVGYNAFGVTRGIHLSFSFNVTGVHCTKNKVINNIIAAAEGDTVSLENGIEITSGGTYNTVADNLIDGAVTPVKNDGGSPNTIIGNRDSFTGVERYKMSTDLEIEQYLYMTRNGAETRFDRPAGASSAYQGMSFRDAGVEKQRLYYDHVNNRIILWNLSTGTTGINFEIDCTNGYVKPGKVTALPTAAIGYRGKMIRVEGGAGVADALYQCRKNAADSYEWVQLDG